MVAADDFMVDSEGNYDFDLYRLNDCHKKCKDTVEDAMKSEKKKIFVHNTFTELWEMKPYFNLDKKYNYRIISIIQIGILTQTVFSLQLIYVFIMKFIKSAFIDIISNLRH